MLPGEWFSPDVSGNLAAFLLILVVQPRRFLPRAAQVYSEDPLPIIDRQCVI